MTPELTTCKVLGIQEPSLEDLVKLLRRGASTRSAIAADRLETLESRITELEDVAKELWVLAMESNR